MRVRLIIALILLPLLNACTGTTPEPTQSSKGTYSNKIKTGDIKAIRVGNTNRRNDIPVFKTKESLGKFLEAVRNEDNVAIFNLATSAEHSFDVDNHTSVKVIGTGSIGFVA